MSLSILLLKQILSMFLMAAFGFALIRSRQVTGEDMTLSKIILYISCPCCILNSFLMEFSRERLISLIIAFVVAIVIHLVFFLLTRILHRWFPMAIIEQASLIYPNSGNFVIPLVTATLGQEYVFYLVPFLSVQIFFFWTHGESLFSQSKRWNLKKALVNPNLFAVYLGLILFFFRISLPVPVASAVNSAANSLGYLSMLILGMVLAKTPWKTLLCNGRVYLICFARLIVFPLIMGGLFVAANRILSIPMLGKILLAMLLPCAAPSATVLTQFAQLYDCDPKLSGTINLTSFIFSVVTVPLMLMFFESYL